MLKMELHQQAQQVKQDSRLRDQLLKYQQENKHLTQQQLYELRVKLQKQERIILQNQASSSIGMQQPFFTPEVMTDEIKTKLS